MSRSVPSLFDDFEDPIPESSGKTVRKIRSRKDNEAIPFSEENTESETRPPTPPIPREAELQFEEAEADSSEITPAVPETDTPDETVKPAVAQNDHLNYIHKELPSEPGIQKHHSVIVLEDIVHKKKDVQESEPDSVSNVEDVETVPSEPEHEEEQQLESEEQQEQEQQEQEQETALPEWELEDKYYSIGEVAKLFRVNTSHIRFWTSSFRLKPRTTRKGDRLYSKEDIGQLRLIHHLVKEKKHTIKGAQEKLKLRKENVYSGLALRDTLMELRAKLVEMRNLL